jgi:hypothetical protein
MKHERWFSKRLNHPVKQRGLDEPATGLLALPVSSAELENFVSFRQRCMKSTWIVVAKSFLSWLTTRRNDYAEKACADG